MPGLLRDCACGWHDQLRCQRRDKSQRAVLHGMRTSALAAWYANDAMITAFFIRSDVWIVSRKSRLV